MREEADSNLCLVEFDLRRLILGKNTQERVVRSDALHRVGLYEVEHWMAGEFFSLHRMAIPIPWALITFAGEGVLRFGRSKEVAVAGSIWMVGSGTDQNLRANPGGWDFALISLHPDTTRFTVPSYPISRKVNINQWRATIEALWLESQDPTGDQLDGDMILISELLARKLARVVSGAKASAQLASLWARVRAEPAAPWDLKALCRAVHMSREPLRQLSLAEVGATPMAYVTRLRMEAAAELLLENDTSIDDIAYAVGYTNLGAFRRAFHNCYNSTPGAWRKRAQAGLSPNDGFWQGGAAQGNAGGQIVIHEHALQNALSEWFIPAQSLKTTTWSPYDLSAHFSRSWSTPPAPWFGRPSEHANPGCRRIRGVPLWLGQPNSSGASMIVLRSQNVNESMLGTPLADSLSLTIPETINYVALLLAAAWAGRGGEFGCIRFVCQQTTETIPLVAAGMGASSNLIRHASLQDWYFSYPPIKRPGIEPLNLAPKGDVMATPERAYLWTLRIPAKSGPLHRIEFLPDPRQGTTLGILAVSTGIDPR